MSRSGYSEDLDQDDVAMWRGQVASATRGRRGQKFLVDLLAALDAMANKRLIRDELKDQDGEFCAIGALGAARGIDLEKIDPEDSDAVADAFGIAHQLAREVVYMNDEYSSRETPEDRYVRMRKWVTAQIRPGNDPKPAT